jgi:4-hydroxy-tetrahydrodipicolinate synthase
MPTFKAGLVHTPVTPFGADNRIDYGVFEKLIEFHLRNGADSLAAPMHVGESVSLTDAERRALLEFTVKQVKGRVPVIGHVSEAGTAMAESLARHAQDAGAAALLATTPYYWTPPAGMLLEHFARIAGAVRIPFFIFNTPEEMPGVKVTTDLALKLIDRSPNFAGIVDASLDWQFMIQVLSFGQRKRADFQLLSGTEYMISAGAIGATGVFAPLAGIAPRLVRRLYEYFRAEQHAQARAVQEQIAQLRQIVKRTTVAGVKAGMRAMGRDCGDPRPPLEGLSAAEFERVTAGLNAIAALREEPRGW